MCWLPWGLCVHPPLGLLSPCSCRVSCARGWVYSVIGVSVKEVSLADGKDSSCSNQTLPFCQHALCFVSPSPRCHFSACPGRLTTHLCVGRGAPREAREKLFVFGSMLAPWGTHCSDLGEPALRSHARCRPRWLCVPGWRAEAETPSTTGAE